MLQNLKESSFVFPTPSPKRAQWLLSLGRQRKGRDDNNKTLLPPRAHNSKGEVTTNVVTPTTTPRRKNAIGGTQPPLLTLTPINQPATIAGGGTTPRANAHSQLTTMPTTMLTSRGRTVRQEKQR